MSHSDPVVDKISVLHERLRHEARSQAGANSVMGDSDAGGSAWWGGGKDAARGANHPVPEEQGQNGMGAGGGGGSQAGSKGKKGKKASAPSEAGSGEQGYWGLDNSKNKKNKNRGSNSSGHSKGEEGKAAHPSVGLGVVEEGGGGGGQGGGMVFREHPRGKFSCMAKVMRRDGSEGTLKGELVLNENECVLYSDAVQKKFKYHELQAVTPISAAGQSGMGVRVYTVTDECDLFVISTAYATVYRQLTNAWLRCRNLKKGRDPGHGRVRVSGWLVSKEGGSWVRRWYVLRDDALERCENEHQREPSGRVPLRLITECYLLRSFSDLSTSSLSLHIHTQDTHLMLYSEGEGILEAWERQLTNALDEEGGGGVMACSVHVSVGAVPQPRVLVVDDVRKRIHVVREGKPEVTLRFSALINVERQSHTIVLSSLHPTHPRLSLIAPLSSPLPSLDAIVQRCNRFELPLPIRAASRRLRCGEVRVHGKPTDGVVAMLGRAMGFGKAKVGVEGGEMSDAAEWQWRWLVLTAGAALVLYEKEDHVYPVNVYNTVGASLIPIGSTVLQVTWEGANTLLISFLTDDDRAQWSAEIMSAWVRLGEDRHKRAQWEGRVQEACPSDSDSASDTGGSFEYEAERRMQAKASSVVPSLSFDGVRGARDEGSSSPIQYDEEAARIARQLERDKARHNGEGEGSNNQRNASSKGGPKRVRGRRARREMRRRIRSLSRERQAEAKSASAGKPKSNASVHSKRSHKTKREGGSSVAASSSHSQSVHESLAGDVRHSGRRAGAEEKDGIWL